VRARYQPEIDGIKLDRRQQVAALKENLKQQIDPWKKSQRGIPDRQAAVAIDWTAKDDPALVCMSKDRAAELHRPPANDHDPSPAPGPPRHTRHPDDPHLT
jgi:hypothetical protein